MEENKEKQNHAERLLKPKNDVVFHALFREENKRLTEALISDILGQKVKVKTSNKDRHLNIKTAEQKLGIIDLRTELEDGTNCNVEIQLTKHTYENERFLYYWADAYSRQLVRGNDYEMLHKTISIIIVDHEIKALEGYENLDTKWQIRDNKTGQRILTEHLEIAIIEIPKALRLYKENGQNKISQWIMFFNDPNNEEVLKIMDKNEDIKEAVEELTIMSKDEELRRLADLREKAIRDERSALAYAKVQGKLEIAKNMLKEKIDIEVIKRVTGLTEDEIQKIQ